MLEDRVADHDTTDARLGASAPHWRPRAPILTGQRQPI